MRNQIMPVMCKGCGGGKQTSCLSTIRSIAENGNIAFMLYSNHVEEKVKQLGYVVKYQYAAVNAPDIPTGMWIMTEETEIVLRMAHK